MGNTKVWCRVSLYMVDWWYLNQAGSTKVDLPLAWCLLLVNPERQRNVFCVIFISTSGNMAQG